MARTKQTARKPRGPVYNCVKSAITKVLAPYSHARLSREFDEARRANDMREDRWYEDEDAQVCERLEALNDPDKVDHTGIDVVAFEAYRQRVHRAVKNLRFRLRHCVQPPTEEDALALLRSNCWRVGDRWSMKADESSWARDMFGHLSAIPRASQNEDDALLLDLPPGWEVGDSSYVRTAGGKAKSPHWAWMWHMTSRESSLKTPWGQRWVSTPAPTIAFIGN